MQALPHSKRFLLSGERVQTRIDLLVRETLRDQIMALGIQGPQCQIVNALPDDPTHDDEPQAHQSQDWDKRVEVGA
ncbi:MAG: hypothetical protein HZB35_10020 [Nitrospirae bacterium]|nr:hypothetical protein [Nitrospirota bacterium]